MIRNSCKNCTRKYKVQPYRVNISLYCSRTCYGDSLKGKPSWNSGLKLTKEHKRKLSEAKLRNPVRYWKGKHTPLQGDRHPNWRGGINPANDTFRKSLEYKIWRQAVFARDNWECVLGGEISRF